MINRIAGNRILIAGSADDAIEPSSLKRIHEIVAKLTIKILENNGGLVLSAGGNPTHKSDPNLSLIFDWTILSATESYLETNQIFWNDNTRNPICIVVYPKWEQKIPNNKRILFDSIMSSGHVELVKISEKTGVGGILRQEQVRRSDILITIGGDKGINHLASLFTQESKPVIPLNIPMNSSKKIASEELFKEVLEYPRKYLTINPPDQATSALACLSLSQKIVPNVNPDAYIRKIFNLLEKLEFPTVFYVRLMDKTHADFADVEWFFRKVVDPFLDKFQLQRHEVSTDLSESPLLDLEIFNELQRSSLVIVDITGLRFNCGIEFGFAMGRGKKYLVTAKEGVALPFDVHAIPCFFWSKTKNVKGIKKRFEKFASINFPRKNVIEVIFRVNTSTNLLPTIS